ncbi:MAG: metallophosphoesterase [Chloroflexota bacterium]|nr:metallophosphoesterase [Chloroflexota bacterium]
MRKTSKYGLIIILPLLFGSCISSKPTSPDAVTPITTSLQPPESDLLHSIFLLGDGGNASLNPLEPTLQVLKQKLTQRNTNASVIFLGDNIMPNGLPPENAKKRQEREKSLLAQFNTVDNFTGNVLFVPGNHDWNSSQNNGAERVRQQAQFIEQRLDRGNTFVPDSSRPGPTEIVYTGKTNFKIKIIALDLTWWLYEHDKPLMGNDSEQIAKEQFLQDVEKAVNDTTYDNLLVVAHHPMYSYGPRGGYFPLKTHLLPPVGGSLYVLYRKLFGNKKDIKHYKELKEQLVEIFDQRTPFIYASGHDHSLQYIGFDDERSNQHYIVSGAASETRYVKNPDLPSFAIQQKGFAVINYYESGIWIEFWNFKGDRIFERQIPN